jgi:hypothetical protein
MSADISDEHIVSIFRIEEKAKQLLPASCWFLV